jgi:hypothetical protein
LLFEVSAQSGEMVEAAFKAIVKKARDGIRRTPEERKRPAAIPYVFFSEGEVAFSPSGIGLSFVRVEMSELLDNRV